MAPGHNPRDRRAQFEQAALPHLDTLYTSALRLTHKPEDSQDLLQETILRGYRCFHQFQDGTNCRAWLLTIMYNLFRSAYRRSGREQLATSATEFEREVESQSETDGYESNDPEEYVARRNTRRMLERALARLPAEFREALLLVDVHELDYQEVATVLDIPIGTVKSRVSRGRALMRRALAVMATERGKTGT